MSAVEASSQLVVGDAPWPKNHWYVAAYSHEISDKPLARELLDTPVVLFRDSRGQLGALFDRCPHRGMPFSEGEVVGDALQCPYHGMEFDTSGQCTHIPSSQMIPKRMCVSAYPVQEQYGLVWIWMGDPDQLGPLPDLARWGFGRADWHWEPAVCLEVAANYLLPLENLLDASHITFLHKGQIDQGLVASHPFEVTVNGTELRVDRVLEKEKQSPLTMKTFGFSGNTATRSIIAEAFLPALCGIRVEIRPDSDPDQAPQVNQLAVGITPRNRKSCYQFTAVAQTFPFINEQRNEDLRNLLMEDVAAMESIQRLHERLAPDLRPEFSVKSDEAAMRARRILARMIEEEA
ncbi:aromatic ring-hydroxylating dioxygenase subunit alpha [Parahaliea sp. F7430]|uniref:Aromatic ring-hydroxylating dioxygenase subunit alpha n=1 Tax=Sediminihaliea albiluteola TaxID=2758564 RepID=A0A7W2TXK3_9GAMM|nr:aromatic ring-hydroxylating dioxygenase subunit alpha [Sediminihaliea albiluteola]MBA6413786.1 aromatic ring-hydroxylating dioxygenase subunit alpha [Sediminihaliea albiluteola]